MIAYPDTSLLVSIFINESGTVAARKWLAAQPAGSIRLSGWTETEFMSAAGNRVRRNDLSTDTHLQLLEEWRAFVAGVDYVGIDGAQFATASRWLASPSLGLKAGDALHLAIAQTASATLWTFDNRMLRAGQTLGLAVAMP